MCTVKQNDDKIHRIYWYIIQLAMCPMKLLVAFVFRIFMSLWHTFVLALILPYPKQIECLQDEAYISNGNRTTRLITVKNECLILRRLNCYFVGFK